MSNVIRFPTAGRIPATAIPRERFEELAQLSLDLVDQIVRLLDATEPPDNSFERGTCIAYDSDVDTTL